MTDRYRLNEVTCPVDLDLLGLLLRSGEARVAEIVAGQEPSERVALALFCFQRAHMRELAIAIAKQCNATLLRARGGLVGEALIDRARTTTSPPTFRQGRITLARVA